MSFTTLLNLQYYQKIAYLLCDAAEEKKHPVVNKLNTISKLEPHLGNQTKYCGRKNNINSNQYEETNDKQRQINYDDEE